MIFPHRKDLYVPGNFHSAKQEFPPGKITPGPCCNTKSFESWTISILPYIEEQTLYDRYDFNAHNEDPENEFVRQAIVPSYMCPSEPGVDTLDMPETGPGNNLLYRRGSYRCMSGRVLGPENYWHRDNELPRNWRGVMHVVGVNELKPEKIKNITDGTSKTLAVGEMATITHERRRTFWCFLAIVVGLVLLSGGCGGAGYGEVPVSGQVTYDGEPLPNVHLSFQPVAKDESGFGPGSFGRTNEEGRFELRTVHPDALGAVAGEHRVTISYENPQQQPRNVRIPIEYFEGTAKFQVPEEGTDNAVIAITSAD